MDWVVVLVFGAVLISLWSLSELRHAYPGSVLLAVLKVFLVGAAGLEGLLRIASFLALGFSLVGIGWIDSRQLSNRDEVAQPQPA